MIKVYGVPGWGSTISELMLTLADIPYQFVDVSGFDHEGTSRELLKTLNPLCQIPTLTLENDEIMTETAAIALMVLDRRPDLAPPVGRAERQQFQRLLVWLVANVYPTFTFADYPERWAPDAPEQLKKNVIEYRKSLYIWLNSQLTAEPYAFGGVPQWVFALAALTIVGTMNMIGVKWFAEMEFWFALIKVLAIVTFLVVGTVFLGSGQPLDGNTTGFHLITDNGGFFPHGLLPALVLIQGVVFAFASIEMVGTAAGECKDPQTMVPKAINSVIWRIGLFYVGSVVLLVMLLPWSAYQAGQSPFVTFFSKLGVPYIGSIMNIVVLTAALSSLNSGLYCTGRILRSMAMGGSAPSFMAKMSRQHVPYAGILATLVVYVVGVFLNYLVPSRVFEIVLNFASLGIIASWAFIIVCQMRLRKAIKEGKAADVSFKLPGAPFTSWLTLLFLLSVLVLMAFDYPNGTYTIAALPIIGILLVIGWFGVRKRVAEIHSTAPVVEEDEEKQEIVFKPETAS